jgi:hypothetical protein
MLVLEERMEEDDRRLRKQAAASVVFTPKVSQGERKPAARHANRKGWRMKTKPPSAKLFPWLDEHYLEDAKAGASDADLARWSGVSKAAIIRWRRSRGIRKRQGTREARRALNLLGTEQGDILHRSDDSPIEGLWEVPEYVLRIPLSYSETARHVYFLHHKLGTPVDGLASVVGIRQRDVETMLALYTAFLEKNGKECDRCGFPTVKTDRYCSKFCWDAAKEEEGDR